MAQGRSTPSLREIEPLLREITDAYHLGVHLGVPAEKLKEFEREYPSNVARHRTEAVSYWRNNCENATWVELAEAVEKVGGHGNLVKKLRERAREFDGQDGTTIEEKQLQQKGGQIHEKNDLIQKVNTELLEREQTPLAELKIPLKLKWRQGKEMPLSVLGSKQAVVIGDNVYVGGGISISTQNPGTVMVYSLQAGSWRTLLPHETVYFGMASVNNQLVLVGGGLATVADALVVLDEKSQTWTRPFPVMPTARIAPSVISYQKWLVVAGGEDERGSRLNKVELLDTLSGQWYEGSPLPTGYRDMSSVINGNMWYLSGGYSSQGSASKQVFSVCLDELISQAVSQSASSTSSPWQTLPESPLKESTALILNGALLTVGGEDSPSIHLYQPGSRSWVRVGDLPDQRWQCACTILPNGELFVAGGMNSIYGLSASVQVYIASVV